MKKWNCNDILRQVAAENGVTLQEVRAGIQETIDVCWNNPDPKMNISSLSDTPDRKKSDTLTAKILHPFRIDGAWRPHGLRTAATPLDHSEIAFSRLMDSPLMVST